ncbi:GTPase [Pannus brasiliensis CCIBt3594]|uniref:GTPase n=1 Tax=Pannus brasiliensis CCIBt3594 TaxID=1427578 RepID=A0AAW9QSF6_9CHRO
MLRLRPWQWVILVLPIALIVLFLLVTAGFTIHRWGINWIWAVFTLVLVVWRFLLVKWTRPMVSEIETAIAEVAEELEEAASKSAPAKNVEETLQAILTAARDDRPMWEDWATFWTRCQDLVTAIARLYYPDVKYPLLNIYIPQAYTLIRGTVDETDRWMRNLSPALNQITVGQAYNAYEVYQKLEPSARKLWRVWNWAQWLLNPAAAVARTASQRYSDRADRQLLLNLGQILRETALRNLCRQSVFLYSGTIPLESPAVAPKTTTIEEILARSEPVEKVEREPVNILLVGRTGAGKSSLINTLFRSDLARVDVLPSTDEIRSYHWRADEGDELTLWDTPGYEQADRADYREEVLERAGVADAVLLVTPALDPALQMDVDFLRDLQTNVENLPVFVVVSGVDRLRPVREWRPPYDWLTGERPKEVNIRECIEYRAGLLGDLCDRIFPVVTGDENRTEWGTDALSIALVDSIEPAKQYRLARFLRDRDTRAVATAKIIDRYTFQMATTQGLTALLKSPILSFLATLTTGSPALARVLAEQIPVEQLPVVIGKLQMAYDLYNLLNPEDKSFDLQAIWPFAVKTPAPPDKDASAFGHALVEYWMRDLSIEEFEKSYRDYLER